MSSLSKGLDKVTVELKWNPSPMGESAHDLDLVVGPYSADDPYGDPVWLVHFDSRSPDGTIHLTRESRDGLGLGTDEAMVLELERMSTSYSRVVVGVIVQQHAGHRVFGDISGGSYRIAEGYTELAQHDFSAVSWARAATIAEFTRDGSGVWGFRDVQRGFDAAPDAFPTLMGSKAS